MAGRHRLPEDRKRKKYYVFLTAEEARVVQGTATTVGQGLRVLAEERVSGATKIGVVTTAAAS